MKPKLQLLCFCLFAAAAYGQTVVAAPVEISSDNIVQWLTPVIVPLIITYTWKLLPKIPSWVIPMLAPLLGVILDVINAEIMNGSHNTVVGALLGLAGVGVREIKTNLIPPKDVQPQVEPITPPPAP